MNWRTVVKFSSGSSEKFLSFLTSQAPCSHWLA